MYCNDIDNYFLLSDKYVLNDYNENTLLSNN